MKKFGYSPFTSRFKGCDVEFFKAGLHYKGEPEAEEEDETSGLALLPCTNNEEWGQARGHFIFTMEAWPMPNRLELRYMTLGNGRCYEIDTPLDAERAAELWDAQQAKFPQDSYQDYVVGTGPYGFIAIWLRGESKSILLHSFQAEEQELNEAEDHFYGWLKEKNFSLPVSREKMEFIMRQYCYRYVTLEEHWDNNKYKWEEYDDEDPYYDELYVDSVEDFRSDGTFNYVIGDESQLDYHEAGMPERISVRWHAGRVDYFAHFWLIKELFSKAFTDFVDSHPDKRVDILLRIDSREQVYVIALRAEGETDYVVLPWYFFKLVVFKDRVQHYKSPNYNLEKGQWSWLWRKKE